MDTMILQYVPKTQTVVLQSTHKWFLWLTGNL